MSLSNHLVNRGFSGSKRALLFSMVVEYNDQHLDPEQRSQDLDVERTFLESTFVWSTKQSSPLSPVSNGANPTINMNNKQGSHNLQTSGTVCNMSHVMTSNKIEPSITKHNAGSSTDGNMETTQASDVLERARTAIASAERAAAELANVKFGSYKLGEGKS
ncbi:hypothetical protein OIU77_014139 [Salix suchowensis]|uniref:Uncharacterized protein n=1 Tax=Salix suchowensis TaxID=1278906 RepID=A0ABQ8ZWH9_9ROSI|nr:hypothetical protein OIU77_014139 [Salix suchowensis]